MHINSQFVLVLLYREENSNNIGNEIFSIMFVGTVSKIFDCRLNCLYFSFQMLPSRKKKQKTKTINVWDLESKY